MEYRGHFFGAAAEAMRRILVESARRKARVKHGGEWERQGIEPGHLLAVEISDDLLALDEALDRLAASDGESAELVKLRYFAGLTIPQAAEALGFLPARPICSGPLPAPGCEARSKARGRGCQPAAAGSKFLCAMRHQTSH